MAQNETAVQQKSQGIPTGTMDSNLVPIHWQPNVLPLGYTARF